MPALDALLAVAPGAAVSVTLRGKRYRIRPLTLADLTDLMHRHPEAMPATLGGKAEALRWQSMSLIWTILRLALGRRPWVRPSVAIELFAEVVRVTMPEGLEPWIGGKTPAKSEEPPAEEGRFTTGAGAAKKARSVTGLPVLEQLYEMASDLYLGGLEQAWQLSPRQIVWMRHRQAAAQRRGMLDAAIAARAAQAEKADFEKFQKALS